MNERRETSDEHQMRVYSESVARNSLESKLHKPELPVNQLNHQANLAIAQGRVHGTVYLDGKARQTQNEWFLRRSIRRVRRSSR